MRATFSLRITNAGTVVCSFVCAFDLCFVNIIIVDSCFFAMFLANCYYPWDISGSSRTMDSYLFVHFVFTWWCLNRNGIIFPPLWCTFKYFTEETRNNLISSFIFFYHKAFFYMEIDHKNTFLAPIFLIFLFISL